MHSAALQRLWESFSDDEKQQATQGFQQLEAEHLTLQELRQKLDLTQNDVAKTLNIRQVNVSKFEHRIC